LEKNSLIFLPVNTNTTPFGSHYPPIVGHHLLAYYWVGAAGPCLPFAAHSAPFFIIDEPYATTAVSQSTFAIG
jgi:hypothetical protein